MNLRRLLIIPGIVLVAIGSIFIYYGIRAWHFIAGSLTASGGFFIVVIGIFLILLSGIFDSFLEKRWGK